MKLGTCIGFLGCCDKLPQTRWLKTKKMYSLLVLEARGQTKVLAARPSLKL